jgi:hypothetical protein
MSDEIQEDTPATPVDGEEPRRRSRRRGRRGKSRGGGEQQVEGGEQQRETREQPQSPPARAEAQRIPDHARARNSVFDDDLDRQLCIARTVRYPVQWPVQYRAGIAIQPLQEVGRTGSEVLLCDLSHDGPCIWPQYAGREYPEHLSSSEDFSDLLQSQSEVEPAEEAVVSS